MRNFTPCLWFDDQAEAAAEFYVSIFENSKIVSVSRYDEASAAVSGKEEGSAMVVNFELDGKPFMALNGGPLFNFTEAVSFVVDCEDQEEVDRFWDALTDGGEESQCGWLKDRFGLSWQVVPTVLEELMSDPDPEKAGRVTEALLQMQKLDIATLKAAHEGSGEFATAP